MNIIVSPFLQSVPKIQLSPTFTACSAEMIQSMNAWLLGMFGTREVGYVLGEGQVIVSPKVMALLKSLL